MGAFFLSFDELISHCVLNFFIFFNKTMNIFNYLGVLLLSFQSNELMCCFLILKCLVL